MLQQCLRISYPPPSLRRNHKFPKKDRALQVVFTPTHSIGSLLRLNLDIVGCKAVFIQRESETHKLVRASACPKDLPVFLPSLQTSKTLSCHGDCQVHSHIQRLLSKISKISSVSCAFNGSPNYELARFSSKLLMPVTEVEKQLSNQK